MSSPSIVSPDDQSVTFVELFFDLVFVFAVTQTVGLLHDGLTWLAVGQAVLVFWLVWWAWTQFTWALNAADTTHHGVELGTLIAVAVAFFMAVSLPDAFHGRALWFAVPYVLVRGMGLVLYGEVAFAADPSQHAAVKTFTILSLGGLAAVLAGAIAGESTQYWMWGMAIFLDVIAAAIGGQSESWNLHPEHFAERHGLFVIIALGESLIVAAGGVLGADWTASLLAVTVLAVAITCALWWTHFTRAKPALDHALEASRGAAQATMARDAFSLIHFPMLCGIIAYAAAVEHAIAHPAARLPSEWTLALGSGVLLFVGGMALAVWRCQRRVLGARLLIALVTAALVVALPGPPAISLGLAFVGVTAVAIAEGWAPPASATP